MSAVAQIFQAPKASPVRFVGTFTTDASGAWSQAMMAGVRYLVQPMTAGEFANSVALSGSTLSVQFRKFKSGGLGITLGTLLTVTAFEDSPGVVNFNLFAAEDFTS